MKVLVSGATGTTGSEVLSRLRDSGSDVRAMTRNAEVAASMRAQGLDVVLADMADPPSLRPALFGVDAVYVATSASPEIAVQEGNLARAAAAAGVRHLVKLSVIGCSPESPIEFGRLHAAAEQAVKDSGVRWTMVRPNGFMQNTLAWATQIARGTVHLPVMDARWSIVDVRDIGDVVAAVIGDPDTHGGEAYTLTGPEPSSPREQVAILAELLGREILAQEVSIEQAEASMREMGVPEWSVQRLGELFGVYADGLAEAVSPDINQLAGHPARNYRQFAQDHLRSFAG